MKEKMCRMWCSGIAVLLALCLVMGACPSMAFAEEAEQKKYVSLGDSMTNGLGLPGYTKAGYLESAPDAYPSRLSQHYGWSLIQLATSGMRAEDLHYILEYGESGAYQGDSWTQTELVENGRWPDVAAVAVKFKESIAEADVISVAVGNANFGVYMADILKQVLGVEDEGFDFSHVTMENAMADLDDQTRTIVMGAYESAMQYLYNCMPKDLADKIGNSAGYVVANYIKNYIGAMDRIIALNPDAEIILVGLINNMSGYQGKVIFEGTEYPVDLAEFMDYFIDPLNAFIAAVPTIKQSQGEYTQAVFYYAEVDRMKTLSGTFTDVFKEDETVVRDRFVTDISQMVFGLLPMEMETIVLSDVKQYEAAYDGGLASLAVYAAAEPGKAASAAYYLAMENSILNSLEKDLVVDLDQIPGVGAADFDPLAFVGTRLNNVMETYQSNLADAYPVAYDAVVEQVILPQLAEQGITTAEEAKAALETVEFEAYKTSADDLATLYVTTDSFQSAMEADELNVAVLSVYGRLVLANGMNSHPSAEGHADLFNAIVSAYGSHTAQDQTMINLGELYGLIQEYGPEIMEEAWESFDTTLLMKEGFTYAAIGDGSAVSASYVDDLAALLNEKAAEKELGTIEVKNFAVLGNTVAAERANLSDVSGSDLITIGFSNVTFLANAMGNQADMDWAVLVGEENVPYIDELMVQVADKIGASGLSADMTEYVSNLVEAYAYSALQYAVELPELIDDIQAVNPDALVVIVGMYNPMKDVVINLGGSGLDMGEYMDALVEGVAAYGTAYALMSGNAVYVDAPEVTTDVKSELGLMDLITMLGNGFADMLPNADGHAYIAAQIDEALEIVFESEGLLGDADGDGTITSTDARLVLQYSVKLIDEDALNLAVCDVDGDGTYTSTDARLILQYSVKLIETFPAAG